MQFYQFIRIAYSKVGYIIECVNIFKAKLFTTGADLSYSFHPYKMLKV
ncbi:hypothetical protein UT300019_25110 [Clostridium sp. CTA-19]